MLGQTATYDQQVGMTLAAIAYADPQYLIQQLAYPEYATEGAWSLRWLGISPGNQMMLVQSRVSPQWAVVIRGSVTDPMSEAFWIDWFQQDLTDLRQTPLPFGNVEGAEIAWGTAQGFHDLIAMRDASTQLTLVEYIAKFVPLQPFSLVVIGHSLGGCLASVLAPYLYETLCRAQQLPASCIIPLTFAAPTAGNNAFAGYMDELFSGHLFRYVNSLDVVPHAWYLSGLEWIMQCYDPAPKISDFFYGLVDVVHWGLQREGCDYTQPGDAVATPGILQGYYWWFEEVGYQHKGSTYLSLYGAPPVIFPKPPRSSRVGMLARIPRAAST